MEETRIQRGCHFFAHPVENTHKGAMEVESCSLLIGDRKLGHKVTARSITWPLNNTRNNYQLKINNEIYQNN